MWREAAELVGERLAGRILKGVGVHRVEAEAAPFGVVDQFGRIVVAIPGDVQRDARRRAGQLMDDGAIVELVEDVARLADAGEAREARAAGADAPGRHGDRERGGLRLHLVDVDVAAAEHVAERLVFALQRLERGLVLVADQRLVDPRPCHSFPHCPFSRVTLNFSSLLRRAATSGLIRGPRIPSGPLAPRSSRAARPRMTPRVSA